MWLGMWSSRGAKSNAHATVYFRGCVGAIHMLKHEEIQPGTLEFLCRDIDGFDKLKGGDDCFKNKKEMIRHYIKLIKRKIKR